MDQDATQLITQRLAELPGDVQSAIQSADLNQKLQAIGAKHQLHIDQVGELNDEVLLAMLGFSPLENLQGRLVQALKLTPEAAVALVADINGQIFAPIRGSMRRFAEERKRASLELGAESLEASAQSSKPTPQSSTRAPVAAAKPPVSPELLEANRVLSEKTVSIAAAEPKPIYKADPYREPIA